MTLQITESNVTATSSSDGKASFGFVSFSDGKNYSFLRLPDNRISFGGYRKVDGSTETISFKSAKREALVIAEIVGAF